MSRLFLLEDDPGLVRGLTFAFQRQGHTLEVAETLREALERWRDGAYDLLVLDVSLPDGSGFDFCAHVRRSSSVPILFLTASDEEMDIIQGLELGGDDYLTKPFRTGELAARVAALLRRSQVFSAGATVLRSGGIRVDLLQGQAWKDAGSDGGRVPAVVLFPAPPQRGALQTADSGGLVGLRGQLRRRQHPDGLHPPSAGED